MDEKKFCLGEDCPDKKCELCSAEHRPIFKEPDHYTTHASLSPSGYYSSGGLVHVRNPKTGKMEIRYARNAGD